jgi:hypothetical protein
MLRSTKKIKTIQYPGHYPVKNWRRIIRSLRGLSGPMLTEMAGLRPGTLGPIDMGISNGRESTQKKIAEALAGDIDIDDMEEWRNFLFSPPPF